jgi:pimeloyl-ACP methyl ester carboxylesterase
MTAHGPAIVIIPGSFSYPILYESVATRLRASGYDVHISKHLSSAGKEPPTTPASLYDDAEVARKIIEEEADAGKDVIVVMHSYGGCVGTQAAKGLCRAERTAEGKPGGIVHLLYINAVVPKEGESNVQSHHGLIGMPPNPAWARVR